MIRIFIQKLKKINDFVDNMGCLVTILCASFIMMTVFFNSSVLARNGINIY